jgi:hypothetical protein
LPGISLIKSAFDERSRIGCGGSGSSRQTSNLVSDRRGNAVNVEDACECQAAEPGADDGDRGIHMISAGLTMEHHSIIMESPSRVPVV